VKHAPVVGWLVVLPSAVTSSVGGEVVSFSARDPVGSARMRFLRTGGELFLEAGVPELVGGVGLPQCASGVGLFEEAHDVPGEPARLPAASTEVPGLVAGRLLVTAWTIRTDIDHSSVDSEPGRRCISRFASAMKPPKASSAVSSRELRSSAVDASRSLLTSP
jgi:hypothetical protein